METYDVAVIGAGPGGYVAAVRAAQRGASVVLIERDALGGTCLNYGCIPAKSFFATAEQMLKMKDAGAFGLSADNVAVDWPRVVDRKDKVVKKLTSGIKGLLKANGVDVITGTARLTSRHEIAVEGKKGAETVRAERIIIATGSEAARPDAFPFDDERVIDSKALLARTELPASILIIGGGYIGCEFASILNAVGVTVTVIEMLDRLLPLADADVSKALAKHFTDAGITVHTGRAIDDVKVTGKGVCGKVGDEKVKAEIMLVAIGRTANIDGIGLEDVGVKTEGGAIVTDDAMRTSVANIFAIGDVTGTVQLAHVASSQALAAAENATGGDEKMDYRLIPGCIFTLPEIGSVGMTEDEAREAAGEVNVGIFPYAALGRALVTGETEGFFKIIADASTDEILGVHVFGAHATDLASDAVAAMHLESTVEELGRAIHAHPTLSEGMMEAAHAVHGECVHLPPPRKRKK